jgi:hypothetical protein
MFNEYILSFTLLTIYTIILHFWMDLKERKVDSRRNHMMIGAVLVIGIISHQVPVLILTGLLTILFTIILSKIEKDQAKVVFGDGDKEILAWSIPGLALCFGYAYAGAFIFLLMLSFFVLAYLRQTKLIPPEKLPGLVFISFAYLIILMCGWFL